MITAEQIRAKLVTDDRWLIRGILAIYAGQTADEQEGEYTANRNNVGYNSADAGILCSFAKQIERWQRGGRYGSPLSPRQKALARQKMAKYAGQLARIAAAKEAERAGA